MAALAQREICDFKVVLAWSKSVGRALDKNVGCDWEGAVR